MEQKSEQILFRKLHDLATIPTKAFPSDSGFDIYASEVVVIQPGETKVVPTGIAVGLPQGTEAQVRPRSGITSKTKLRVQLGTIDNGYRGEIGVMVDNIAFETGVSVEDECDSYRCRTVEDGIFNIDKNCDVNSYIIRKGDKIAQLVVQHLPQIEAVEVDEITGGDRGGNGFGSSGTRGAEK